MHPLRTSLLLVPCFAACDRGSAPPAATVTPDVAITAANALDVAAAAYHTVFDPVQVARLAALFLEVPPPEPSEPPNGPASPAVVVQELEGPEGGTAIFTWDDRDRDERYSTGDTFTIAFADYGAAGRVLTGPVTFDAFVAEGDLFDGLAWRVTARLQLLGVRVAQGASRTTLAGSFRCARELRATVRTLAITPIEDVQVGVRVLRTSSEVARNDYVLDFSMGLFAAGSFTDPLLGGTLTFATEAPLTGVQVLADPGAGLFTVEGANGSTLSLQPLDFFTLEILVDEDGDGEVDATIPAEWAELGA